MKKLIGLLSLLVSISASADLPEVNRKIIASCTGITNRNENAVHVTLIDRFDQNLEAEISSTNGEAAVTQLRLAENGNYGTTDGSIWLLPNQKGDFKKGGVLKWNSETLARQFMLLQMTCAVPQI